MFILYFLLPTTNKIDKLGACIEITDCRNVFQSDPTEHLPP
jgi:hypothetical protein